MARVIISYFKPTFDYMNIDAVVTWVDSTDPKWIQQYQEVVGEPFKPSLRFTPTDNHPETELKMCLRLIKQNMPWIRNIFVVTKDGQVPKCLTNEIVVHHSDIGLGHVFNSLAIESSLHNIPGLSEQFVYFNDDIFVVKPLSPDDLFDSQGRPIVRILDNRQESEWANSLNYTSHLVNGEKYKALPHVPHPLTKRIMAYGENTLRPHWDRTRKCPLRYRCNEVTPVFASVLLALQNNTATNKTPDPIRDIWIHTVQSIPDFKRSIRGKNVVCLGHYMGSFETLEEALTGSDNDVGRFPGFSGSPGDTDVIYKVLLAISILSLIYWMESSISS